MRGITEAEVNRSSFKLRVVHEAPVADIERAVADLGFTATPAAGRNTPVVAVSGRLAGRTTAAAGAALATAWLLGLAAGDGPVVLALYLVATLVGGFQTYRKGLLSLWALTFDMNALMLVGVTGALLLGAWSEAAMVAFLYAVGNALERATQARTRAALHGLMTLTPGLALVRRGDGEVWTAVEDLEIGDAMIVKPGERVAVDGVVALGTSAVDQAPVTGESVPVAKAPGDVVFAGSLNGAGVLEVTVTHAVEDSTLARIIHMVEEAQGRRAAIQGVVDRFARWYTPAVLVGAALVAIGPPLLLAQAWQPWIYKALTLIVLACPCALVVSTPIALVAAIGGAARRGVLIKGGTHLEAAARIRVVAFDKTGTLTAGRPEVREVVAFGKRLPEDVLHVAAAVLARSDHPLAAAIGHHVAQATGPDLAVTDIEAVAGHGVRATRAGQVYHVGSPRWLAGMGLATPETDAAVARLQATGHSLVLVADGVAIWGAVALAAPPHPGAGAVIQALKRQGVARVVLLTGDNPTTAQAIGAAVGADEVRADLLPEDKVAAVRELAARYGPVAMVGDGINDAPALAAADLGIAMGAAGTDVAIETADMTLMADDLAQLPYALSLGRATLAVIHQNIAFAIAVKVLATALVFPAWLTLWMAVLADMGATILVTLNALRLFQSAPRIEGGQRPPLKGLSGSAGCLGSGPTSGLPTPATALESDQVVRHGQNALPGLDLRAEDEPNDW